MIDIGFAGQPHEDFDAFRLLQIQPQALLVAVDHPEIGAALPIFFALAGAQRAGVITDLRVFDLDDFGTEIGQMQRGDRTGQQAGQVKNANAGQRPGAAHSAQTPSRSASSSISMSFSSLRSINMPRIEATGIGGANGMRRFPGSTRRRTMPICSSRSPAYFPKHREMPWRAVEFLATVLLHILARHQRANPQTASPHFGAKNGALEVKDRIGHDPAAPALLVDHATPGFKQFRLLEKQAGRRAKRWLNRQRRRGQQGQYNKKSSHENRRINRPGYLRSPCHHWASPRRRKSHFAAQFGHFAQAGDHRLVEPSPRRLDFAMQHHAILPAGVVDHQAHAVDFRMALAELGDLLGMHEHALDLGRLVSPPQPALEADIAAPQGERPGMMAERSPVAKRISG
jgi:hypothetical protein